MPTKLAVSKREQAAIRARNARYKAATPAGKRVMLAREVLRLIEIGTIEPRRGLYIDADLNGLDDTQNAQPFIATGQVTCQVCAKGALFVSAVSIRNGLKLEELTERNMGALAYQNSFFCDRLGLLKLFGARAASVIERWFEFDGGDAPDQLILIMKNIIKNKGTFKPDDE